MANDKATTIVLNSIHTDIQNLKGRLEQAEAKLAEHHAVIESIVVAIMAATDNEVKDVEEVSEVPTAQG